MWNRLVEPELQSSGPGQDPLRWRQPIHRQKVRVGEECNDASSSDRRRAQIA